MSAQPLRRVFAWLPSLVLWLAVIGYLVTAWRYNGDARLFPLLIGAVLLFLLPLDILSVVETRWSKRLRDLFNPGLNQPATDDEDDNPSTALQLVTIGSVFGFAALLMLIGVMAAIPLYVFAAVKFLGARSWTFSIAVAALLGVFTYALFVVALDIDLYPGVLFNY